MSARRLRLLGLLALAAAAGCAGSQPPACLWPRDVAYSAAEDSLGLAPFHALTPVEQDRRRAEARQWRLRADGADRIAARLSALRNAVGLAPDDANAWLELARFSRAIGDRAAAAACLDNAAAAVPWLPSRDRPGARLHVALERAWLHRDRGEWDWGLAWVDSAAAISPRERETRLLQGLLLGERGGGAAPALLIARDIRRERFYLGDANWIEGMAAVGDGMLADAYAWLPSAETVFGLHRADQFNDCGLVCERLGELSEAERFYRKAGYSLPLRDPSCLKMQELPLTGGASPAPTLPVWLTFDRFYAAGSLHAYARLAAANYERAAAGAERSFWGDAAVSALSVCIRKGAWPTESRALRGRVFMQMDLLGLADADLTRALREEREGPGAAPATLYWLGLLRIKGEQPGEAIPLLREAVAADSSLAPAWSSLGYALVVTGRPAQARAALDRALALDPRLAEAWYNRGLMHLNAAEWAPAVADLERAADLAPGNLEIAGVLRRARAALQKHGPASGAR